MADDLDDALYYCFDQPAVQTCTDLKKESSKKKGKKRKHEPSLESLGDSKDEPHAKTKNEQKKHKDKDKERKKMKKKSPQKFLKKKITDEDEETLKKGGTPEDINAMLASVVKRDKTASQSDSDDEEDDYMLSIENDFLQSNDGRPAVEYLSDLIPGWQAAVKKAKLPPGNPLILILCSSAIRAVQLNRDLKTFLGKDCKTAKLFAKHMKLEKQKKFLQTKVCQAGIGTPNRVHALLESGTLKLDRLHFVVLDWNWRDVKLKRMVDIPDVKLDLRLLLRQFAVDKIRKTACRVAIL